MHYKKIGVVVAGEGEYKPLADANEAAKPLTTPYKDAFEFACGKDRLCQSENSIHEQLSRVEYQSAVIRPSE